MNTIKKAMATRNIYRVTAKEFTDKCNSLLRRYIWFSVYRTPKEKSWVAMDCGRRLTLTIREENELRFLSLRHEDTETIYMAVH